MDELGAPSAGCSSSLWVQWEPTCPGSVCVSERDGVLSRDLRVHVDCVDCPGKGCPKPYGEGLLLR